jgi:hypothetical protein
MTIVAFSVSSASMAKLRHVNWSEYRKEITKIIVETGAEALS